MKNSTLLCLLLLPFLALGQSKHSIGLMLGIDQSFPVKTYEEYDGEKGNTLGRFGFNYNQKMNKRTWIEVGFRLAKLGYASEKRTDLVFASEILSGMIDPNEPHEIQFFNNYTFFEVPLGVKYYLNNKKIRPFLSTGLSYNLLLNSKTTVVTDLKTTTQTNSISNSKLVNLSVRSGLGIEYSLNSRTHLFLSGAFRYYFVNTKNKLFNGILYNYGLEMGVSRSFGSKMEE
jgi:Outer membrane protein beta-barrel domain